MNHFKTCLRLVSINRQVAPYITKHLYGSVCKMLCILKIVIQISSCVKKHVTTSATTSLRNNKLSHVQNRIRLVIIILPKELQMFDEVGGNCIDCRYHAIIWFVLWQNY